MAFSRECASCGIRWPTGWAACPACQRPTVVANRSPNRSQHEARLSEFERLYTEREAERIAAGDVAPETVGRREAKELLAIERQLREDRGPA